MDGIGTPAHAAAADAAAAAQVLPLVYDHLRAVAGSYFRGQRLGQTLQPTALVHEAYLKLADRADGCWKDRAHFVAIAATAMRQILMDHARGRRAAKRGGQAERIPLTHLPDDREEKVIDLVALDGALTKLAALDERQARLVELRFFGGLNNDEVAAVLGVSTSMIEKEWRRVRAWLGREMSSESAS